MKKLNVNEMRAISGGLKCLACGKTFSGLLGWAAAAVHIVKKDHWDIEL